MSDYARGINRRWWTEWGQPGSIHDPALCEGQVCPVHHPTRHHLRHLPRHWRWDRGMLERICEHGVGHPDPDQVAAWKHVYASDPEQVCALSVHGCDGCCRIPGAGR